MAEFHCAYCGKYGYGESVSGPMGGTSRPKGWVQNKSWGFGIKYYCSKKCKLEDEGGDNSSSKSYYSEEKNHKDSDFMTAEQKIEMKRLELEEKRMEEKKKAKNAEERKIKSQKFKDKGWIFIAWLVEIDPVYAFSLFFWPLCCLLGPGMVKLIGIIPLFILVLLLIKDIAKLSWKVFAITCLLIFGLVCGVFYFLYGASSISDDQYINDEELLEGQSDDANEISDAVNISDALNEKNKTVGQIKNAIKMSEESSNNTTEENSDIGKKVELNRKQFIGNYEVKVKGLDTSAFPWYVSVNMENDKLIFDVTEGGTMHYSYEEKSVEEVKKGTKFNFKTIGVDADENGSYIFSFQKEDNSFVLVLIP